MTTIEPASWFQVRPVAPATWVISDRGHDAIYLLKEAIEKAGTTDADKLVAVLEKISYVGAAGVIEFDKRHDPLWGPGKSTGIAVQWQDGKKVPFWPPNVKGMKPFRMPAR